MILSEITPEDYDVDLVMAYATADNLMGRPIYRRAACFLHPDAGAALRRAIELARPLGLRLRIFDAFRPVEAHDLIWRDYPNPTYVADPARGSNHSRGVAIDLTLTDDNGKPLEMGSGFDAFTTASHHGATDILVEAQRNRFLFLGLMAAAGWRHNPNEWWHYQLPEPERYPLLTDAEAGARMM